MKKQTNTKLIMVIFAVLGFIVAFLGVRYFLG